MRRTRVSALFGLAAGLALSTAAQAEDRYPIETFQCAFGPLKPVEGKAFDGKPVTCEVALPALKRDFGLLDSCVPDPAGTPAKVVLGDRIELSVITLKTTANSTDPVLVAFDRKTGTSHTRWLSTRTMIDGDDVLYALKGISALPDLPGGVPAARLTFETTRRLHLNAPARVRTEGAILAFVDGQPRWVSAWVEATSDEGKATGKAQVKIEGDKVTLQSEGEGVTPSGTYAPGALKPECPRALAGED